MNLNEILLPLLILAVLIGGGGVCWWRKARKSAYAFWILAVWLMVGQALDGGFGPTSGQKKNAQMWTCVNNLKRMSAAVQDWADAQQKRPDDPVDGQAVKSYLGNSQLVCPSGGSYSFGRVKDAPKCTHAAQGHTL
jgi:hypothetical protein